MQLALDLFLAFGSFCLFYGALRGPDYGNSSRLGKAMNFVPANITLRLVLIVTGMRVLGDALDRHDFPQLRQFTKAAQFQHFTFGLAIAMIALVGYALLSKRVQAAAKHA